MHTSSGSNTMPVKSTAGLDDPKLANPHEEVKKIMEKSVFRDSDRLPDLEKFEGLIKSELAPQS